MFHQLDSLLVAEGFLGGLRELYMCRKDSLQNAFLTRSDENDNFDAHADVNTDFGKQRRASAR